MDSKENLNSGPQEESGKAEVLRRSAEFIFKQLGQERSLKGIRITFQDIEYLNGYFVFDTGENSVVHFRIRECPGWKFGLWWDTEDRSECYSRGTLFAQYERCIDKFKPMDSVFTAKVSVPKDPALAFAPVLFEAAHMLRFIRKEPLLAYCRAVYDIDYNREHHNRLWAFGTFLRDETGWRYREAVKRAMDWWVLRFVQKKVLPEFLGVFLKNCGENHYPRYKIAAPYEYNRECDEDGDGPGYYSWPEDLYEAYHETVTRLEKLAKVLGVYWGPPIQPNVMLVSLEVMRESPDCWWC